MYFLVQISDSKFRSGAAERLRAGGRRTTSGRSVGGGAERARPARPRGGAPVGVARRPTLSVRRLGTNIRSLLCYDPHDEGSRKSARSRLGQSQRRARAMKAGGSSKARKRATSNASGKSEHSNYAISVDSRESGEGSAGSRQLLERRQKKGAARKGGDGDNDIVKGIRDDGSGDKENVHGRRGRRPSFSTEDVEQSVHDKAWTVVLCALVVIFSCAAVYRYSANIRAGHAQSWDLVLVYGLSGFSSLWWPF